MINNTFRERVNIAHEDHVVDGKLHRENDLPARRTFYEKAGDPQILIGEEWWVDGERHREGGPAVMVYQEFVCDCDGGPGRHCVEVEWHVRGKLHREDGPAMIRCPYHTYKIEFRDYVGGVRHSLRFLDFLNNPNVPNDCFYFGTPITKEQFVTFTFQKIGLILMIITFVEDDVSTLFTTINNYYQKVENCAQSTTWISNQSLK